MEQLKEELKSLKYSIWFLENWKNRRHLKTLQILESDEYTEWHENYGNITMESNCFKCNYKFQPIFEGTLGFCKKCDHFFCDQCDSHECSKIVIMTDDQKECFKIVYNIPEYCVGSPCRYKKHEIVDSIDWHIAKIRFECDYCHKTYYHNFIKIYNELVNNINDIDIYLTKENEKLKQIINGMYLKK